jgi:hypothetical protein
MEVLKQMATRGEVGIKNDNGFIVAAYNHFDSYIEGLGKTLVGEYNTAELARKFINRIIDSDVTKCSLYNSEEDYCKINETSDLNYIYLFKNNEWLYKKAPFDSEWYSVKDDLNANVNIHETGLN